MAHQAATYGRIRAAVRAAAAGESTTLEGTTELSSMYAAQYAEMFAIADGYRGVVVTYDGMTVSIAPAQAAAGSNVA